MSLLPVSATRTSSSLTSQRLLYQLTSDQLAVQRQYDQLSSGRRVLRLSDDPAAANRALGLNRGIDRGEQLVRNANAVSGFYQASDDALSRVNTALINARAAAVEGVGTIISDDEREAIAMSVRESIQTIFAAGNSMFRDQQLLGGILDAGNAFQYDESDIVFTGHGAVGHSEVGAGTPTAINVTASETLGAFAMILEGEPLNAALDHSTRLVDMRSGKGVETGVIRISGGTEYTEVDLRTAASIGDVADVLNALEIDGRKLDVKVFDDSIQIDYADGLPGTLAIEDMPGSSLASDLSIQNTGGMSAPPIIGDSLSPRVTTNTKIEDLAHGVGLDLSSGITINQGSQTFTVDLSEAETMGDVLIAINRSEADIQASLNESEGRIQLRSLRSGVDYSIGENNGNAARSLGIRSATEQTTLDSLGRGRGMVLNSDTIDLTIVRPDGQTLEFDLESAITVDDVMTMIRDHPDNQDAQKVLVSLNLVGNGIELQAPPGAAPLTVRQSEISNAGTRLGLIPNGQNEAQGVTVGPVNKIAGIDYMPLDAGGALDTLTRLEKAILDGDIPEIERLQQRIDEDFDRSTSARSRVGIWSRNLEDMRDATGDQVVQMKSQLSDEVDADLATVISEVNRRQIAMEASMRIIGQMSQLTLLNFL
ncbi:flagellar hook-associated protein FlgL [Planctomycetes bacterium CA13]|uniref:Flagellin n=1 Tax=Novipirellula herctigrandis TaxID=2527986 RepID=A0A5C5YVK2_9BACT|nr:flagellar hook-associated protein FlgL [Planctomycetes bacterium CA13]